MVVEVGGTGRNQDFDTGGFGLDPESCLWLGLGSILHMCSLKTFTNYAKREM